MIFLVFLCISYVCFVSCVCVCVCILAAHCAKSTVSTVAAQLLTVTLVSAAERQAKYESVDTCTSDAPQSLVKKASKIQCAAAATEHHRYRDYTFDGTTKQCSLYKHKPLFYEAKPGCTGYQAR